MEKAREIGQPMNVAVAEIGGNSKAFARMEEAWTASIAIAQDKAYTAASLGFSTQDLAGDDAAGPATLRPQHHQRRPHRDLCRRYQT